MDFHREGNGYAGNMLYIDLTTRRIRRESFNLDMAKKFIGGPGIGLNVLHDLLKPNTDPHSPENVMVFGTGPLLGTTVPASSKCYFVTKYTMPASKHKEKYFISSSMFGSNRFGVMMKNAGYDHVVITGRAEKPCYLKITDKDVEICDASDIWGKDIYEVAKILREKHRGRTGASGTWVIGKAGENLVRPSLGFTDDWHNAGRFAGSVAGSKNLKAIVTLGAGGIRITNIKKYRELIRKKQQEILAHPKFDIFRPMPAGKQGEILTDTLIGVRGCSGGMCCACKTIHELKEGEYEGSWWGASFRTAPFRAQMRLQLKNHEEGFKLIELMNKHGLCRITVTNMLWFLTKLYERDVVSKEDTGGLELRVGDLDCYLSLIEKMINREGIGANMAEGWHSLCEKVGVDASTDWEAGYPIIKGVDVLVDARAWPSLLVPSTGFCPAMGLAAVVNAKTKHSHSNTYWPKEELSFDDIKRDVERMGVTEEELDRVFTADSFNSGRLERYDGDAEFTYNALGICDTSFHQLYDPMRDIPWLSEVYSAVTGFEISPRELLRTGERIWNLEKLLNMREGFTREDDIMPPLYIQNTETPLQAYEGDRYLTDWFGNRLSREDLEQMVKDYYEERGWDVQKGVPRKEKLVELGLEDFIGTGD